MEKQVRKLIPASMQASCRWHTLTLTTALVSCFLLPASDAHAQTLATAQPWVASEKAEASHERQRIKEQALKRIHTILNSGETSALPPTLSPPTPPTPRHEYQSREASPYYAAPLSDAAAPEAPQAEEAPQAVEWVEPPAQQPAPTAPVAPEAQEVAPIASAAPETQEQEAALSSPLPPSPPSELTEPPVAQESPALSEPPAGWTPLYANEMAAPPAATTPQQPAEAQAPAEVTPEAPVATAAPVAEPEPSAPPAVAALEAPSAPPPPLTLPPASSSDTATEWVPLDQPQQAAPKPKRKEHAAPKAPQAEASPQKEGATSLPFVAPGAGSVLPPPAPSAPPSAPPPSSVGDAPPVASSQMVPEAAAKLERTSPAAPEELSPETEQILGTLPQEIIGRPPAETPGKLDVERAAPREDKAKKDTETEAEKDAEEALSLSMAAKNRSLDLDYELEKAYVALTAGNTEEAIRAYQNVLDIDPNNTSALFGLATTYHRVGLLDQARPIYGKLLKLDPKNKDAINNFLVLVGEEAPARALEHMRRLEEENPGFAPIPAQMALLYSRLGDHENAIQSMQRAVNIAPENLVYKYNLAILYDKAERAEEASVLYREILEAHYRGENIPADARDIQERLTFLISNK